MKKSVTVFDLRTATIVETGQMERAREALVRALMMDQEWRYMRVIERAEKRRSI